MTTLARWIGPITVAALLTIAIVFVALVANRLGRRAMQDSNWVRLNQRLGEARLVFWAGHLVGQYIVVFLMANFYTETAAIPRSLFQVGVSVVMHVALVDLRGRFRRRFATEPFTRSTPLAHRTLLLIVTLALWGGADLLYDQQSLLGVTTAIVLIASAIGVSWWIEPIATWTGSVTPAPAEWTTLSQSTGIPGTRLRQHHTDAPRITFLPSGAIALTDSFVSQMSADDIRAIVHYRSAEAVARPNHRRTALIVFTLFLAALVCLVRLLPGDSPLSTILWLPLIYGFFFVLNRHPSLRSPSRLDSTLLSPKEILEYGEALEHWAKVSRTPLNQPLAVPRIYDRMIAAGCRPDYDKPRPPSVRNAFVSMLATAGVVAISTVLVLSAVRPLGPQFEAVAAVAYGQRLPDDRPGVIEDSLALLTELGCRFVSSPDERSSGAWVEVARPEIECS